MKRIHLNVLGGARLLRCFANQWKWDLTLVIASYNAGAGTTRCGPSQKLSGTFVACSGTTTRIVEARYCRADEGR